MVRVAPGATYARPRRLPGRWLRGWGMGDGVGSVRSVPPGEPQAANSRDRSTVWAFGARATMAFMDARTHAFPWVGVIGPPHPRGRNGSGFRRWERYAWGHPCVHHALADACCARVTLRSRAM